MRSPTCVECDYSRAYTRHKLASPLLGIRHWCRGAIGNGGVPVINKFCSKSARARNASSNLRCCCQLPDRLCVAVHTQACACQRDESGYSAQYKVLGSAHACRISSCDAWSPAQRCFRSGKSPPLQLFGLLGFTQLCCLQTTACASCHGLCIPVTPTKRVVPGVCFQPTIGY